jgi:hypothetical protein
MVKPACADLLLATVPLVEVDSALNPIRPCSGCVVQYRGVRLLLTVQHSTGNEGNWAAVDRYDPEMGLRLYQLGPLHFLLSARLGEEDITSVDLAFVRVPDDFAPVWQQITPRNGIEMTAPRIVLSTTLMDVARANIVYGFAGMVHVDRTTSELFGDAQCENNLTLFSEDADWYHFALNHPHPGDDEYRGCSGAPVLDAGGRLVALLAGRSAFQNCVRATPLARYRAALDLSLGLDPEGAI